jgi:hypothetical protein
MNTPATAIPGNLLQAFTLGSWRRLDQLDVPAFRTPQLVATLHAPRLTTTRSLHSLPAAGPRELLPLAAHLAGHSAPGLDTALALSLLLRHLATPSSHQPDNTYAVHRAVPSPRCLFPCRVVLLQRRGSTIEVLHHEPDHHALARGKRAQGAALRVLDAVLGPHTLALIGVARFWAMADKYGAFAPFTSMLEAGHLQSQLGHLVAALGWMGQAIEGEPDALRGAATLCEGPLEAVAFGLRCTPPGAALVLPAKGRRTAVAGLAPNPDLEARFAQLPALARQFAAVGSAVVAPEPAAPAADVAQRAQAAAAGHGLLALMRQRSAGNDAPGLAPGLAPLAADSLPQLLALTHALRRRRVTLPAEPQLHTVVMWLDEAAPGVGLYRLDGDGRAQPWAGAVAPGALGATLQASLPYPWMRLNLAALKCSVMLCADLPAAQAVHGDAALRRLHQAAGALAHDFSLAAAALGLFARPVRMLNETVLEAAAALPGLLIYQVLCGLNRATNTVWEL